MRFDLTRSKRQINEEKTLFLSVFHAALNFPRLNNETHFHAMFPDFLINAVFVSIGKHANFLLVLDFGRNDIFLIVMVIFQGSQCANYFRTTRKMNNRRLSVFK